MHRYYHSRYPGKKSRKKTYFLLLLAVFIAIINFAYGYYSSEKKTILTDQQLNKEEKGLLTKTNSPDSLSPEKNTAQKTEQARLEPDPACESEKIENILDKKYKTIIAERNALNNLLMTVLSPSRLAAVKEHLAQLSQNWLFSSQIYPQDNLCLAYEVQPGDMFVTISRKFNVPYKFIMQINNITDPQSLIAGQQIKVPVGPFHIRINPHKSTLDLYLQGTFVRSFDIKSASFEPGQYKYIKSRSTRIELNNVSHDARLLTFHEENNDSEFYITIVPLEAEKIQNANLSLNQPIIITAPQNASLLLCLLTPSQSYFEITN